MPLFGRGHELSASPLSTAVPLDGTDTVPGLRTLEQTIPAAARRQEFVQQRRYQGPHLEHLTMEHLTAPPKPWKDFFEGPRGWSGAYGIPRSWPQLMDRAEENIVAFLPNYLRAVAVCFMCILYMAPLAAVGLLLMFIIWDYMRTYTAQRHLLEESWEYKAIYVLANVAMWAVALKSRGMMALTQGLCLSAVVVLLHSCGKITQTERRPRRNGIFRRGAREQPAEGWLGQLGNLTNLLGVWQLSEWLGAQCRDATDRMRQAVSLQMSGR